MGIVCPPPVGVGLADHPNIGGGAAPGSGTTVICKTNIVKLSYLSQNCNSFSGIFLLFWLVSKSDTLSCFNFEMNDFKSSIVF